MSSSLAVTAPFPPALSSGGVRELSMAADSKKRTFSFEDLVSQGGSGTSVDGPSKSRPRASTFDCSSPPDSAVASRYNPKKAVSAALQSLQLKRDAAQIAQSFLTVNPPLPLRAVTVKQGGGSSSSSSSSSGSSSSGAANGNNSGIVSLRNKQPDAQAEEVESPERWRDRIWPTRAVYSFCRAITRCRPPLNLQPGQKRDGNAVLGPYWPPESLQKIPLTFDSSAQHAALFFMHLMEECRESAMQQDEHSRGNTATTSSFADDDGSNSHGWCVGQVMDILAETERGRLPNSSGSVNASSKMGSIWVLRMRLSAFSSNLLSVPSATISDGGGGPQAAADITGKITPPPPPSIPEVAGGDLLLLQSSRWERPVLAVVQGWDPDYELKFTSLNFNSNAGNAGAAGDGSGREFVNILVCVDHGDSASSSSNASSASSSASAADIGGWVQQGCITPGVKCHVVVLGNVMTSIRECQALSSLRVLNKPLQQVIVKGTLGSLSNASASASAAAGGVSASTINASTVSISTGNSLALQMPVQSGPPEPSPFSPPPKPVWLQCPDTLPSPLWDALKAQFNPSQLRAIRAVCHGSSDAAGTTSGDSSSVFSLLQGPPGTGKTKTILAIIAALLAGGANKPRATTKVLVGSSLRTGYQNAPSVSGARPLKERERIRVLVCAPSNTAVDEIVYRLKTQGVLGGDGQVREDLQVVRIGQAVGSGRGWKSEPGGGHDVRGQSQVLRVVERCTLDFLVDEKRKSMTESGTMRGGNGGNRNNYSNMEVRKGILESANVVCCTLSGAGSQPILEVVMRIPGFKFDAVIIDEAAQAIEPSTLIPLKYNPQTVVMVGDPCQLPATLFSKAAKDANYGQSLFQRLNSAGYPMIMLETQYRMHQAIADYPSHRFYNGKLKTDPLQASSKSHDMPYHTDRSGRFRPFVLHDLRDGRQTREGDSIRNDAEVHYVLALYEDLARQYPRHKHSIGIIAPYRAQRRALKTLFRDRLGPNSDIEISTIDGFQGREKDIVIFSCVRAPGVTGGSIAIGGNATGRGGTGSANFDGAGGKVGDGSSSSSSENVSSTNNQPGWDRGIGFLKEWQRLNVAITRAKFAMWVVGHVDTLQADAEWSHLVEFCRRRGYLLDANADAAAVGSNIHSNYNGSFNGGGNRHPVQHASGHFANSYSNRNGGNNNHYGTSSSTAYGNRGGRGGGHAASDERGRARDGERGRERNRDRERDHHRDRHSHDARTHGHSNNRSRSRDRDRDGRGDRARNHHNHGQGQKH